jgi:hypothetical protein
MGTRHAATSGAFFDLFSSGIPVTRSWMSHSLSTLVGLQAMNKIERMSLSVDTMAEMARNRTILASLADIRMKSDANCRLSLSPDFTVAKAEALLKDFTLIYKQFNRMSVELTMRKEDVLLDANISTGYVTLNVMASDDAADKALVSVAKRFEPFRFVNKEEEGVWLDFVYNESGRIARHTQFIKCPPWKEIRTNYPPETRAAVDRLLALKTPWALGRLVIWHGCPGSGKTYAIRAMLQAWKDRFDFIVVNDPENFTASPSYYYQIASRSAQYPTRFKHLIPYLEKDDDDDDEEEGEKKDRKKRRLFIMEDSADLVIQESRMNHYDKLGKLLNMTDGLYGQGREDLFILTFNEQIDRIDGAFLRPGRCITKTEFMKFSPSDAASWLRAHEAHDLHVSQDVSIAELYAKILSGKDGSLQPPVDLRQVGFGKAPA